MSTRGVSWSYLACAFKSDLNGKVDESKGILLLMRGILLFSKPNVHPRVDSGAQREASGQTFLDRSSVFPKGIVFLNFRGRLAFTWRVFRANINIEHSDHVH